ncbi:PEPxxWA-CTERM sorting domain-containing protein [Bradyrhizobium sp. dw_78]|uniref:PEPxxWA-CTERM sorting domain-containing protein n=1 Tax=Bradyrhizobium sp. dw_78 TaxID=2719793 RepID=UPI001BD23895|nr:PEPxxWA-CTERM sorting domain-containing protein [Bradyrhizobium sp. dw_78]
MTKLFPHRKLFALISLAGALAANAASADTVSLPNSIGVVQLSSLDTHSYGDDTWSPATTVTITDGPDNLSTATVSPGNQTSSSIQPPYAAATVANPPYTSIGQPAAFLTYYFEVSGPSNIAVPVDATGIIQASGVGGNTASAFMEVYPSGGQHIATVAACSFSAGCTGYNPQPGPINQIFTPATGFDGAANYSVDFDVESNTVYEILLGATAQVHSSSAEAYGSSSVNATLAISPDFAGYTIDLSQGIASAVPEPSTWAMMILGFCGLGFMAYRRKQSGPTLRLA